MAARDEVELIRSLAALLRARTLTAPAGSYTLLRPDARSQPDRRLRVRFPMAGHLFISYSSAQAEWARSFRELLSEALPDLELFFDQAEIRPGDDHQEKLEAGLRDAKALLLLASPEALASHWVIEELKRVRDKDKGSTRGLIAARIVPVELPEFTTSAHVADFTHRSSYCDDDLHKLVSGLAERFQLSPPKTIPPLRPCEPRVPDDLRRALMDVLSRGLAESAQQTLLCQRMKWREDALDSFDDLGGTSLAAQAAWAWASRTREEDWLSGAALLDALEKLVVAVCCRDRRGKLSPHKNAFQAALAAERERSTTRKRTYEPQPAAGPSPESLLARYLTALEHEHRDLIPLAEDTGRNKHVEHVYVELVVAERERQREHDDPEQRLASVGLADLLRLRREGRPGVSGRWLLRGDPGSGKSTLLRHFAHQCARKEVLDWTPMFLSLARLFAEPANPDPDLEALSLALFEREPTELVSTAWSSLLRSLDREGRLLVLLDGLDEVPTERMDDALTWLRRVSREWQGASVVVTTRKNGYRQPSTDFLDVDLQPLGRQERIDLLAHWLPLKGGKEDRQRAETLVDDLTRVQSLRELAGNPLHLTLFALLAGDPAGPGEIVLRRSQLFARILDLLARGGHKPHPDPQTPFASPHVRQALRHLAYGTTVDNVLEPTKENLLERLEREKPLRQRLRQLGKDKKRWGSDLSLFLDALAKHTTILGPFVAGPDGPWRFLHKTFREALTAEQLERRVNLGELQTVLDEARRIEGDEGRWAEPFALLAGSLPDPNALILALKEVRPSLARAALATAEGVDLETAQQMVELRGNVEERGRTILGLVDTMASPVDGVRLLARLAGQSRDGSDLYFYYEALRAAEGRPDCATLAREARRDFFDGFPLPSDPALFRKVATCKGERELWARVEAGVYTIGSPDGVGHPNEHPQHEVELSHPFRIGIVPVTDEQLRVLYPRHGLEPGQTAPEGERARHPAVRVTWYEATTFARWLAWALEGRPHFERHRDWMGRLPTEAMWEVACRARSAGKWCFGDAEEKLVAFAWFTKNAKGHTHPVGLKEPNAWGLHDVHGNVWEWCSDAWQRKYTASRVKNPEHREGHGRVLRGGSYWDDANWCRSACRSNGGPWDWDDGIGFRVVLPALPADS